MALMKNDAEAQTLFDSLKVKHPNAIEEENRIAIDAIRDYFNFSEPISIEKIETEVVASKTVEQRLLPDAKVLVVIDIDNTQWDRFDQMNCVYIGMETVNKAFEYYHEFADADYILLSHRDQRTYLFKTHDKPSMQNEKPVNGLGRSYKKPSKDEMLMWPDMLYMTFPLTKADIVPLSVDVKSINNTAPILSSGARDYYSPRIVKVKDLLVPQNAEQ
jgi:hypothetical protein